jgi:arrestin-2
LRIGKRLTTAISHVSGTIEREKAQELKKRRSIERSRCDSRYVSDEEDNIVFEDFARLRLSEPE